MTNPLAGHTAAQNTKGGDGLRDGDSLSSATLVNMLGGLHGNGILRLQDAAFGTTRNETNSGTQPGAMDENSSNTYQLDINGGVVCIDGVLYEFGGGPGETSTLSLGGGNGTSTVLTSSGEQSLYAIYVVASTSSTTARIRYAGGSAVDTTRGLYPTLPEQFVINPYPPTGTVANEQIVLLASVRCQYVSSGGGTDNVDVLEVNDKRVFLRSNPNYMLPLSKGTLTADSAGKNSQIRRNSTDGIMSALDLRSIHTETGDLGTVVGSASQLLDAGALWMSTARYGTASLTTPPGSSDAGYGYGPSQGNDRASNPTKDVFLVAGQNNHGTSVATQRVLTRGVEANSSALATSATWSLTSWGDSFFMLKPNAGVTITLNPVKDGSSNYDFPEGHIIEVCNDGDGTIEFNDDGTASATITVDNTGAPPPGVQYVGSGDTIQLISTAGTTVVLTMGGTGDSTTSAPTSGTTLDAKTLSSGSYATSALHATAQAVEIRTAINHHTEFTATNSSNVITVTQVNSGSAGNTTMTITELGATGLTKTNFTGGGGMGELVTGGKRATFIYEGSVWVRCDYQAAISALMTSFQLEDGDGTEVTINDGKEVKFVEGGGVDINWTDTSDGSDSDPYDMTFTLDVHGLTEEAIASGDYIAFSDEGTTDDPTKRESIDDIAALFAGDGLTASSAVMAVGAGTLIDVQANQVDVDLSEASAAVMVGADEFIFLDNGSSNAASRETLSDLLDTIAGTVATTGIDRSGDTLVVSDLHPVGVSGAANQLLTDDGDGTVTSESKALVDGAKLTIGDATAEDTMLVFDGNAIDYRIGIDDTGGSAENILEIGVGAAHATTPAVVINTAAQVQVVDAFAANVAGTFGTFADGDATPSVATGNLWKHHASTQTITMFDDGVAGQTIHVISTAAITYDVTSTNLKGGSTDIVTASGDITTWTFDGTNWYLVQFMDVSADMSSVGGGGGGASALDDLSDVSYGSGDLVITSLDTLKTSDSAHNAAGTAVLVKGGTTTAGTTNNIAGGNLTLAGGQGKGSGAGGDIIFQTANAAASGSSLNALATALTISDDLGSVFTQTLTTSASTPKHVVIDTNTSGVAAQDSIGLHVDFDRTVAGSGTAAHNDIGIDLDVTSASLGTSSLIGMDIDVVGATSGTSTATGLTVTVGSADTNYAALFSGGNVGIGTSAPAQPLHVERLASATENLMIRLRDSTVNAVGERIGIEGYWSGVTAGHIEWELRHTGTGATDIVFSPHSSSGTTDEALRITSSGTVGVGGVTAPAADLEVLDTTTSSATQGGSLRLSANDGATMADDHRLGVIEFAGAEDGSATMTVGARIEAICDATWSASENGASMAFYTTDGNATQTEVMRITSDKFVGIGTDAPNQPLTIEGTMSMKEQAGANADVAAYGQLWIKSDTPNSLYFTDDAGNDVPIAAGAKLMSGTGLYTDSSGGGYWTGPGVPTTVNDAINRIAAVVVGVHGQIG